MATADEKRKSLPTLRVLVDTCHNAEAELERLLNVEVDLNSVGAIRALWTTTHDAYFNFKGLSLELEQRQIKLGNTSNFKAVKTNRYHTKRYGTNGCYTTKLLQNWHPMPST